MQNMGICLRVKGLNDALNKLKNQSNVIKWGNENQANIDRMESIIFIKTNL